jgi:hypothetical protein
LKDLFGSGGMMNGAKAAATLSNIAESLKPASRSDDPPDGGRHGGARRVLGVQGSGLVGDCIGLGAYAANW